MADQKSYDVRKKTGSVRVRKNIRHLSDQELLDLRKAYAGLYEISATNAADERGYRWIAGVHGSPPPVYCQHGSPNFLTWHRAYVYEFEKRLQDIVPSVNLPYWDWTSAESLAEGIPDAVSAETYVDENGDTKPNPLHSALGADGDPTVRSPGAPASLQIRANQVASAMLQPTFSSFSNALENPHGGIHVWVGGDMGSVPTAAFDPIFWLHHCNVDRQWWQWQQDHPAVEVPQEVQDFVCAPFPYTGVQTLDSEEFFGITYAETEVAVLPADSEGAPEGRDAALPPAMAFDLGKVPRDYKTARLQFHDLYKPKESYEIRVFVNEPNCDANTDQVGNDRHAGTLYVFGHGGCLGAPGHCDVPASRDKWDHRLEHHLRPYSPFLDVTDAVRAAQARGESTIKMFFIVVDAEGDQTNTDVIEYEGLSLLTLP